MPSRRRRTSGGLPALAILAALASWPAIAAAQSESSRVLLVHDRAADAAVERAEVRLAAELRAAGFIVEERVADGDDEARKLVEEPEKGAPFATVLLRRSGARTATDVWVADHVTHKTVVRRIGARGAGDAGDRALALRVVELMRASLVEGLVLPPQEEEPAAPAPPPPPPDVAAWTREAIHEPGVPAPLHLSLAAGVAGAFAGANVGPAVGPELHVAWRASSSWSFGVLGAGPAFGGHTTGTQGSASVRQELALADVLFQPWAGDAAAAFLTLGAGAYHLYASGDATAPFTSGHDDAWALLVAGGAGVRLRLSRAAFVVVDVRELLAFPRPVIAFAGQNVADSMHPGTLGTLSLAVEL